MTDSDITIETVATALHRAAVEATPSWVRRSIQRVATAQGLQGIDDELVADAAERATAFVDRRMGALLTADIDAQQTTPLSIFRDAVRFPVEVLHAAGATSSHRGDVSRWAFPNDPFDITPGNLSDIGDEVQQAGIVWGAAKAGLHLQRRRQEGLR